ncbi:hypothetical protein GWL_34410 [Herbaspirillum sp. GW103]|nr:hypothetical protein GWL_34410 [Herbaspirillum sp. GW103]
MLLSKLLRALWLTDSSLKRFSPSGLRSCWVRANRAPAQS